MVLWFLSRERKRGFRAKHLPQLTSGAALRPTCRSPYQASLVAVAKGRLDGRIRVLESRFSIFKLEGTIITIINVFWAKEY